MEVFNKSKIKALKKYIYESYIHDAEINVIDYNRDNNDLTIDIDNPIFGVKAKFHFTEVRCFVFLQGDWIYGDAKTINALVVEDDYSNIQNLKDWDEDLSENSIYLLCETFSGDQLHIISNKVEIEATKYKKQA